MAEQTNGKVLAALVRQASNNKAKIAEINGELGERIKHHIEHSNLHPKAFRLLVQLTRMDELKRKEFLDALRLYCDMTEEEGIWPRHSGDLVEQAGVREEAEPVDEDAEAAEANAARLRAGIQRLDEESASEGEPAPPTRRRRGKGDAPGTYRMN